MLTLIDETDWRGLERARQIKNGWNEYGNAKFTFGILAEITSTNDPARDYYEPEKSRAEKLQMIARNRKTERWQQS